MRKEIHGLDRDNWLVNDSKASVTVATIIGNKINSNIRFQIMQKKSYSSHKKPFSTTLQLDKTTFWKR